MRSDLAFVLILLAATIGMFALNRPRMDAVALIMMTALPLTGVITMTEALAGLSDPNIVLIAALFVIGEGLVRTGVAKRLGDLLVRRAGKSESRLVALLMLVVAGVGSFMSSTGVVAIFIPAVLRIARHLGVAAGRLMMPLSVAALISGMTTLIATAPNLVVHSQLVRAGYQGFHFFSFAPFGVPILALGILYMLAVRRRLAASATQEAQDVQEAYDVQEVSEVPPRPRVGDWIKTYDLAEREHRLRLTASSPWVGKALAALNMRASFGLNVIAVERPKRFSSEIVEPTAHTTLRAGDTLFVDARDPETDVDSICRRHRLEALPLTANYFTDVSQAVGMAELMIPASSTLIGSTTLAARLRSKYQVSVIGLKRGRRPLKGNVLGEALRVGDTLLVAGPWRAINRLHLHYQDLIVLMVPAEVNDVIAAPHALLMRSASSPRWWQ